MQTALTQLHMQIEFLRRVEKTAVCGLSGFKFTKRHEESFSSAAAEPQLTELSHRACGIKHNNPSEAVRLLGCCEAWARTVLSDFWYMHVCLFPKELLVKFCSTSYCAEECGVSSQPTAVTQRGSRVRAAAAIGSTANFILWLFFLSFSFLKYSSQIAGTEGRGLEREQSRTPHSWGMGLGLPQQYFPCSAPCTRLAPWSANG